MARFFSQEEIQAAKDVDLVDLLSGLGIPLKKHSGSDFYHMEHDSLKISRHNGWFWNSKGVSGNVIDYFMKGADASGFQYNLDFTKAVECVLTAAQINVSGNSPNKQYIDMMAKTKKKNHESPMTLPVAAENNNRVIAYLNKTRGIDYDIIKYYIKSGSLYESFPYHNCVFVGKDSHGNVKYAFQRGTIADKKFAGDVDGSDKSHSFKKVGVTESIHIFEAPIDILSYETMNKLEKYHSNDTLLSLGGVGLSSLDTFLSAEEGENIRNIFVRTDNDKAGKQCAAKIKELYGDKYNVIPLHPIAKDYNEDLLAILKKKEILKCGMEIGK